jgi:hypothetical protein
VPRWGQAIDEIANLRLGVVQFADKITLHDKGPR